ncbi:MAG TPA: ATP-binding cassette domain-containing protein [Gemmatimonadales bacterium]|nr:ATP-binding cassette domain-containing protein [Gemmatimonadales bacterium]
MLSARDLEHRYGDRVVLSVPEFTLPGGSITALTGPNGSGKSTLLRILACVERPTRGMVLLGGQPLLRSAERRQARRRVTLVEQRPLLFRGTVAENLAYALLLHGVRGSVAERRVAEALARMDLTEFAHRDARAISDGEVQRVAIARALALEPAVLLLDEPVGAADPASTIALYRAIEQERARGAAICFASHQIEDAFRWSDRLKALANGSVVPVTPVNLFRTVIPQGEGPRLVRVGPLEIQLVTDRSGPVTISIPPDDVVLSQAPLRSSARNTFQGRIVRIGDDGKGGVAVTVDVGVDLHAHITRAAMQDLALTLGAPVVVTFKTMAVRVF